MRRPALPNPRFAVRLALALTLALAAAGCSQLSSEGGRAKPASPPVLAIPQAPAPQPAPVPSPAPVPAPPPQAAAPVLPAATLPGRTTAAFLVPLSGPAAAIGTALFNAAQMAVFEVADDRFTLLPFDTKGTTDGAVAAAQQAVAQHADIVLGPLFSAEAKAVGPVTRQAGIPMIAFTADLTAAGGGTYVLGFLPGPQAVRVADWAHSQSRNRLAVLAPSNDYGRTVAEYLANNAAQIGITIAGMEYYDANAADLSGPIKRLLKRQGGAQAAGDPGFDGLLLPDEGQRLRTVAAALPANGIDPQQVKLLGTMLWEDSKAGSEPSLVGGWYPVPPDASHADFDGRYAKTFGGKPPRLASLGYDATALAAVLGRGGDQKDFSARRLTVPTGFAGVDGIFRLRADGSSERGYAIREVDPNGQDRQIAPAPAAFQAVY